MASLRMGRISIVVGREKILPVHRARRGIGVRKGGIALSSHSSKKAEGKRLPFIRGKREGPEARRRCFRLFRSHGGPLPFRDPRGQATAEFAMVLPFLLLVFLLLVQAVLVMRAQIAVTAAAREGARKGVETGNLALIEGAAARAASGLDQEKLKVRVESGPRKRGEWIRVEVEYDVPIALPAVERFFPRVTVRSSAEMRIENDREGA
ncbi:TadE/TadG family type IV pilus assembly protein [Candidatus Solincola sp.]